MENRKREIYSGVQADNSIATIIFFISDQLIVIYKLQIYCNRKSAKSLKSAFLFGDIWK